MQDSIMVDITDTIALLHTGDRSGARNRFTAIWSRMQPMPDPYQECVLSHYMADLQDEIEKELSWDIRAFDAARRATDEAAKNHHPSLSIKDFFPSLHLNLADDYLRLGEFDSARRHLQDGLRLLSALTDSPYTTTVRGGFERIAARLND
ncbi:hypothetical protein C7378_2954 [Acidipila rosea]|uniref:Tetratricopeptide repeat protein n=2 Tax=Acidipila rosea TaxID=768535 RepID=A0A4V2PUS5_9BACT|nr:hypothetical protein C7378_2954 [Acidipila rosea]